MIAGGCKCGAVRYTVDLPHLPTVYACHCTNCQTWSGSAFTEQFFLPQERLHVTGEVTEYRFVNPMNRVSVQRFCPTCHVRLYNTNMMRPGVAVVRAGTLDRSNELDVGTHIWVRSKQPWVTLPEGAQTFEEGSPVSVILALTEANGGAPLASAT